MTPSTLDLLQLAKAKYAKSNVVLLRVLIPWLNGAIGLAGCTDTDLDQVLKEAQVDVMELVVPRMFSDPFVDFGVFFQMRMNSSSHTPIKSSSSKMLLEREMMASMM